MDHLGRDRRLLVIKASGADLRIADAGDFVALYLDDLVAAEQLDRLDDAAMTDFLAHARADLGPRTPSIETLLHAFLPAAHVDHVHADAICALTNGPRPEEAVREALGADAAYVRYLRPGFELAKRVADAARSSQAVVLGHHGLVTWAATSDGCHARTLDYVVRAGRYVAARTRPAAGEPVAAMPDEDAEALLLALRGRLSRNGRRVLALDRAGRDVADRADAPAILDAGPATADHLLRIRPFPVLIRRAADVAGAVDASESRATGFWERHRDPATSNAMRDLAPAVTLVPGLGTVAAGRDMREAALVRDVARRTHAVAAAVIDAFGAATPLGSQDLFDLEYWPLELAKLRAGRGRDLEGRVVIVTGAASGIGRDIAVALAALGAHVALADRQPDALAQTVDAIGSAGGVSLGIHADLTLAADVDLLVRRTVLEWGGIDGVVSNAGVAVTGRIESLSLDDWSRSLAVNATAHFLLARRVIPALRAQGIGGSLVFIGSKNAFSPGEAFGAYSVAKAAEVQLMRMVAIEAGRDGVRANVVSPDAVFGGSRLWGGGLREERAAAHGVTPDELERFYAERSLLKLPVRGSDVADAVAFLLSDRSSRMTGCVLTVDSGVPAAFPR
jgi:rhamnose utilization protein RhaD (predicted bifunctional aldolase and dehydrogenase)/NAD(P)-dependent dehydrogenase (short-subunit alcohol dehydrogenase family)